MDFDDMTDLQHDAPCWEQQAPDEAMADEAQRLAQLMRLELPITVSKRNETALTRYLVHHQEPTPFIRAVLVGDLLEVARQGNREELADLPELIAWIYRRAPMACWGTPERVRMWLDRQP